MREGEGQVATIIGEAGIGKSRLVRRFREEIATTPYTWLEAGAGAFFQNTPFYPIIEVLRQLLSTTEGDRYGQLESRLASDGLAPADAIPLIAPLLDLPPSAKYSAPAMSPEQQRRRLLVTLVGWLVAAARVQPLVLVIEDLHWVDPSTLELIQLLVEQGSTAPLLLLYTARPEFHPPWSSRAHHIQLTLNRLSMRETRTMVSEVSGRTALSDETIATVVERTSGVPLFVEELTRAVLEGGEDASTARSIPATLHDSLMARLDRLGPAKEAIQVAAILGGEFSYGLLRAVYAIDESALQGALRTLADAELLYARGIAPDSSYQFKHALIRDAAYGSLLKSRRRELHLAAARSIDTDFPSVKHTHPEVLARHWTEAGDGVQAIRYLNLAGEQAALRASHSEAIAHFREALDWLDRLPPRTDETTRCSVLAALGREQRRAGQNLQSRETLLRAAELARLIKSTELLLNVGLDLTRLAFTVSLPVTPAPVLFEEALGMLGGKDSPLRARTLSGMARALAIANDQRATSYGEEAVAMCRRLGSPELLLDSLNGMAYALSVRLEDAEKRLDCANEMLALAQAAAIRDENLDANAEAFNWKVTCSLDFGDMHGIDAAFEALDRRAEDMQEPFVFTLINVYRATLALMQGRFEDGERLAREALTMGQRLQTENGAGIFGQQMFALRREQGRLKELEPAVRFFVQQNQAAATWRPGLALIYSELGRRAEAQAEFEHLAKNDFADFPRDGMWMGCMSYLSEVCTFLGDRERAAILYELLLPFDGRTVAVGAGIVCCGALSRYLGALAATMERWDDAIQHFEDALTMNARMGAHPWLAHTQHQYACMLLARGQPADRDRALALIDSALSTTRELGMQSLEERLISISNPPPACA